MVRSKSLDYIEVINRLLLDVQTSHSNVFTPSALRKTLCKVKQRYGHEGLGFLTKTLPRLGKHLLKVLALEHNFDSCSVGFAPLPESKLPRFLGELFKEVLNHDGSVRHDASTQCVAALCDLLFVFYKLELESDPELELQVVQKFVKTENELKKTSLFFDSILNKFDQELEEGYATVANNLVCGRDVTHGWNPQFEIEGLPRWFTATIRQARLELYELFASFDHLDIYPRHGPGAVSTQERCSDKYVWWRYPERIARSYPFDEYFSASGGHRCDTLQVPLIEGLDPLARVILVPKDSRGPRLISCEPLEYQWIQQGLGRAISYHVEHHPLTRESVRFTDQEPNKNAAKIGSIDGKYSTLDLNEASDRVSLGLVRLLFPEPLKGALLNVRSLGTTLPNGEELTLNKYAPMGSALCFPVLAVSVWSVLYAFFKVTRGADHRKVTDYIYVYGDDVIVPTAQAANAMTVLESFGFKINRDKSCTKGLFRESCGMDAFKGSCVTPIRVRTPWTTSPRPESYVSWMSYARSFWDKKYYNCYEYIVDALYRTYGPLPCHSEVGESAPWLPWVPEHYKKPVRRVNEAEQRFEYNVLDVVPVTTTEEILGWNKLLRYFAEHCSTYELHRSRCKPEMTCGLCRSLKLNDCPSYRSEELLPLEITNKGVRLSVYTKHKRIKLRRCWR